MDQISQYLYLDDLFLILLETFLVIISIIY